MKRGAPAAAAPALPVERKTAEGVGFEPTSLAAAGFQDRCIQPLCHPSRRAKSNDRAPSAKADGGTAWENRRVRAGPAAPARRASWDAPHDTIASARAEAIFPLAGPTLQDPALAVHERILRNAI